MLTKQQSLKLVSAALFLTALSLSGCGGSSENQPTPNPVEVSLPVNDAAGEIVQTQCGSSAASMLVAGNTAENAPTLTPLFSPSSSSVHHLGSLSGFNAISDVDYWGLQLIPGDYRLVIDVQNPNFLTDPTEIITQFSDTGTSSVVFTNSNQSSRFLISINVSRSSVSTTLSISTTNSKLDYQFSVVRDGGQIPSPRYVICPDVAQTAIGNTEFINLNANAEKWLMFELPAGVSNFPLSIASNNLASSSVEVDINASEIGSDNQPAVMIRETIAASNGATLTLESRDGSDVYLRFVNKGSSGVTILLELIE